MAIIIPSKNIYEKENNKIRDNIIDKLQVQIKELGSTYNEETQVYSKKLYGEEQNSYYGDEITDFQYSCVPRESDKTKSFIAFTFVSVKPFYYKDIGFNIPSSFGTSYILSIKDLINENGENNIQCNVFGKTITYEVKIKVSYEVNYGNMEARVLEIYRSSLGEESPLSQINLPVEIVATTLKNGSSELVSKIERKNLEGTISSTKLVLDTDLDTWKFDENVSVLTGLETITGDSQGYYYIDTSYAQGEVTLIGEYIKYEPKNIKLIFNGVVLGINIEDNTISIGDGIKYPFSIDGNELLQFDDTIVRANFSNTLTSYQNGKETATILCSISDYYDENGNKAISISDSDKEMVFRMYDEVIPMVYGSDGKDRPMSRHQDGSAKVFRVLGVEPIYDGTVWQRLTLQEV